MTDESHAQDNGPRDWQQGNLHKIRTVGELLEDGWSGEQPHYDAELVSPCCGGTIRRDNIDPKEGESRSEASKRAILDDGRFEVKCPECGSWLFRDSCAVYDYRWSKETHQEPEIAYSPSDLPIKGTSDWSPNPYAAAVLTRYFHKAADIFPGDVEHVSRWMPWELDPQCPLCREQVGLNGHEDLDFHHWTYEPEQGVSLCRECHMAIHDQRRAHEQSELARTGDWVDDALMRLVRRHQFERRFSEGDEVVSIIKRRYNIPFSTNRIRAAYDSEYGDCKHQYVRPPHCGDCGKVVVKLENDDA